MEVEEELEVGKEAVMEAVDGGDEGMRCDGET